MSAAALFTPGSGDFHVPVTVRLAGLPSGEYEAASRVYNAAVDLLRRGKVTLGEAVTDRFLRNNSPWLIKNQETGARFSLRFVQKGLKVLERLGIIRRVRQYGRRTITFLLRLRGKAKPKVAQKPKADPDSRRSRKIEPGTNGVVAPEPATDDQLAAIAAAQSAPAPEPTPEELAESERIMEEIRRKAEAIEGRKGRPRPKLEADDRPRAPDAPGMAAQAALEGRRKALGIVIAPEPKRLE